jgi:hypothetical protein
VSEIRKRAWTHFVEQVICIHSFVPVAILKQNFNQRAYIISGRQSAQDDGSNVVEAYDVKAETTGGSSTMQNAGVCDALKISLDVVQGGAAVLGAGGGEKVVTPRKGAAVLAVHHLPRLPLSAARRQ